MKYQCAECNLVYPKSQPPVQRNGHRFCTIACANAFLRREVELHHAAPDMRSALQMVLENCCLRCCQCPGHTDCIRVIAKRALRKAGMNYT